MNARKQPVEHGPRCAAAPRADQGPTFVPMPTADADSFEGKRAALEAVRAPHAIAIRGMHALTPEAAAWTGDSLAAEFGDLVCHCLAAPTASNRFTYYWGGEGDEVSIGALPGV